MRRKGRVQIVKVPMTRKGDDGATGSAPAKTHHIALYQKARNPKPPAGSRKNKRRT